MEATELRIGNYINVDGSIYEVTALSNRMISCGKLIKKAKVMHTNGGSKSPIPLTPEILEKIEGFVTNSDNSLGGLNCIGTIEVSSSEKLFIRKDKKGYFHTPNNFKRIDLPTLHHLQNYIYYHTQPNTELTIKL